MGVILPSLPKKIKGPLRWVRDHFFALLFYGKGKFCPVCRHSARRFLRYGVTPRDEARCPHCGSLERHRLLWLYLKRRTNFFDGLPKTMLHVAPEKCLQPRFAEILRGGYVSADLSSRKVRLYMDVTALPFADETFDIIYCSHVLEHVPEDKKALQQFYRSLKKTGWAILLVPIGAEKTLESQEPLTPRERLRLFGQEDHVRIYGADYVDRLKEVGFDVTVTRARELVSSEEALQMGLTPADREIFYCRKTPINS